MGNTSSSAVQTCLESALGGNPTLLAVQGSPLFEIAHVRPYNLGYAVTPAAVTYPETSEQVAEIVKCALNNNLKVQPRSGGHSYANYGIGGQDNAIVVDLSKFQQFSMNKETWQATMGAGTLLGDVTKRLQENGNRAMAHGTSPQIGIGGHATIGGLGPSSRMWGLALDHVEEVEVVLANSTIVRASESQHPDVFFAIKGAAAGFGIVTEFKVRTQPAPGEAVLYTYTIQAGSATDRANAFKKWQSLASDTTLSRKFASNFVLAGPATVVTGTFFGSKAEFDSLNISSRLSDPKDAVIELKDWLGVVGHWAEDAALRLGGGIPANFYAKSLPYTKNDVISDDGVDKLFDYIDKADKGGAIWAVIWDLEGGAISDVAPDATSYGHRDAIFFHQSYVVNLLGAVNDKSRAFLTGINDMVSNARSDRIQGAYAGYVDPALGADSATDYWSNNVARLVSIKSQIDPADVFHNPQSIRPASKSAKLLRRCSRIHFFKSQGTQYF
ncbi:hypothetical protein E8E13_008380 [Curvularia kusanoi]|uniref:FAD-binding PCMH-type domain-containing protein n=1 Tax=Curvularia kusanoi TaxID=90978 RepID=A0A9P4TCJ0_CURKU|nr:hypothetical protein E8E13_008380 [Curvularia kusanoi]